MRKTIAGPEKGRLSRSGNMGETRVRLLEGGRGLRMGEKPHTCRVGVWNRIDGKKEQKQ
jgi:hypothetical protein